MIKKIGYLAIAISILLLTIVYFVTDKKLFYYGKNDLSIYHALPLGIQPEFRHDFDGGFVLWDKYGFALSGNMVSVGEIGDSIFQYHIIKGIIKYGYDKNNLVTLIKDTAGNYCYIEYFENTEEKSKNYISMKVKGIDEKIDFKVNRWIDVKNIKNDKKLNNIVLIRNFSLLCIVALIFTLTGLFMAFKIKN